MPKATKEGYKLLIDLEEFDKIELTKNERDNFVFQLNIITKKARRLNREGKISKIIYNRVNRLWLFIPREENQKRLCSYKEYCKMFSIKPLDLIKTKKAIEIVRNLK